MKFNNHIVGEINETISNYWSGAEKTQAYNALYNYKAHRVRAHLDPNCKMFSDNYFIFNDESLLINDPNGCKEIWADAGDALHESGYTEQEFAEGTDDFCDIARKYWGIEKTN